MNSEKDMENPGEYEEEETRSDSGRRQHIKRHENEYEEPSCCNPKLFTRVNIITIVMIVLLVACIIVLFLIDESKKSYVYGIISMLFFVIIGIVCCTRKKHNRIQHVDNSHYHGFLRKRARHYEERDMDDY